MFEISMTLRSRLADAFQYLVSNDNFYCKRLREKRQIWLIWQWKWQLV